MKPYNELNLIEQLEYDEGCMLTRYKCPSGFNTIGIGHNCDANPYSPDGYRIKNEITKEQAHGLLSHDIQVVVDGLSRKCPQFRKVQDSNHENRRRALINMGFQLGVNGLLKFKNMLKAIDDDDWELARAHALDSDWAKQTPQRADRVTRLFL